MQTALLIFIVVFALAIGFFLGLFLLSLDAPFLKKLFQKEDESQESTELNQTESPSGLPPAAPDEKRPTEGSKLLLQVWKEEGQPPVYEFNGVYASKENLPRELLHVITIQEEAPAAPTPQAERPVEEQASEPAPEHEVEDEPEVKMLSVVDEVNDILQHKLHGSPMAGKGIHLMENHNQEIRFWVGLQSYSDVSEIPDQEIQRLINEAVREWEQSRG